MSGTTALPTQPAPLPILEVTDSLGRKLKVQKLDILKELDLIEGAGKASENGRWMLLATLAACIIEIDGIPLLAPTTREKIRAHISRVGSEGIAAVAEAFNEDVPEDAQEAAATGEQVAKN